MCSKPTASRSILLLSLFLSVSGDPVLGASPPHPLSPAGANGSFAVASSCPTFSWTHVPEASGYELVVLQEPEPAADLGAQGTADPELAALQPFRDPSGSEVAIRRRLPAGASSWTPDRRECLSVGQRYVWSVRAIDGRSVGSEEPDPERVDWGDLAWLEVPAAPSIEEVEAALEVLNRWSSAGEPRAADSMEVAGGDSESLRAHGTQARQVESRAYEASDRTAIDAVVREDSAARMSTEIRALAAGTVGPPALADASLSVSGQVHLGGSGAIFRQGELLQWDDAQANTALGRSALSSALLPASNNTAMGRGALQNTLAYFMGPSTDGSFNSGFGDRALQANTIGRRNTAVGSDALLSNTIGVNNVAVGARALENNEGGDRNSAVGTGALFENQANGNTAVGYFALRFNQLGTRNTALGAFAGYNTSSNAILGVSAIGYEALRANTTGARNTALGSRALFKNTTGTDNVAVGALAGYNLQSGSNNVIIATPGATADDDTIRIGDVTHAKTFIGGIEGADVGGGATTVVVNGDGQLGTISSTRRVKQDIEDLAPFAERLADLRPVSFRYRAQVALDPDAEIEFGLIAEEVAEVFPELVVYDGEGRPKTVKYRLLGSLLLAESQALAAELERLEEEVARLRGTLGELASRRKAEAE